MLDALNTLMGIVLSKLFLSQEARQASASAFVFSDIGTFVMMVVLN